MRENFKCYSEQFTMDKKSKLVIYECAPTILCNDCFKYQQAYRKAGLHNIIIRFQAFKALFVVDVNVVQKE